GEKQSEAAERIEKKLSQAQANPILSPDMQVRALRHVHMEEAYRSLMSQPESAALSPQLEDLAQQFVLQSSYDRAGTLTKKPLAFDRRYGGGAHPDLKRYDELLAAIYRAKGQHSQAAAIYEELSARDPQDRDTPLFKMRAAQATRSAGDVQQLKRFV